MVCGCYMALRPNVSIRYIAVLGFQPDVNCSPTEWTVVSIRYIAVLGFQRACDALDTDHKTVSIRYIAVLGFQLFVFLERLKPPIWFQSAISRYLVSNLWTVTSKSSLTHTFQSAISRYLVSNAIFGFNQTEKDSAVSIRYIAVLGFQHTNH